MQPESFRKSSSRWMFVLVFTAAVAASTPALAGFFWADDFWLLREAAQNPAPLHYWETTAEDFEGYWPFTPAHFFDPTARYQWYFRPVQSISMKLEYTLFGAWPPGFHLHQSLLAGLAAIAFLFMARRVFRPPTALVAALLFALMPTHAEADSWICARSGLLAITFGFFAVGVALNQWGSAWARSIVSMLLLLLALLSKEDALVLPLFLAALLWLRGARDFARYRLAMAWAVMAVCYLVLAKVVLGPPSHSRVEALHVMALMQPGFPGRYLAVLSQYLLSLHTSYLPVLTHLSQLASLSLVGASALLWWGMARISRQPRSVLVLGALALAPLLVYSITVPNLRHLLYSSAALALALGLLWQRFPLRAAILGPLLLLLGLLSAWQHYNASAPGRMTRMVTRQFIEQCGLPGEGERAFVADLPWPVAFFDKAVAVEAGIKDVDLTVLSLWPLVGERPSADWQAFRLDGMTLGYGPESRAEVGSDSLTLTMDPVPYFASLLETYVGIRRYMQGKSGLVHDDHQGLKVYAARLRADNLPSRLHFVFGRPEQSRLCRYRGDGFEPLRFTGSRAAPTAPPPERQGTGGRASP